MWEDPEDGFEKKNLKEFEYNDLLTMYSFINWVLNQGLDITRQTATTFDSFVMYEEYEFNISKPTAYEEGNLTINYAIVIPNYYKYLSKALCIANLHRI